LTSIGPWQLREELGRGGMGVVRAAIHAQTGAKAAVKTVHRAKAISLHAMRREIETLATLVHPGVVRILDHGVTPEGLPWYAMEQLHGQTLRTARLGRRRALTVLSRVCETLAWLHGEGVVHSDLKPDNIFLRKDGTPVLVDFGLRGAYGAGREAVSMGDNLLAGTAQYTAPEQIQGRFVDARADLYSLGCILFEQLTGRPPFLGSVWELVEAQVNTPAPHPKDIADDVPSGLDALTISLLRKEPRERIGHAGAVARVLTRYGARAPERPTPPPRPYVYRPSLHGREAQWEPVRALLERAEVKRQGALIVVRGQAGMGKTRLLNEAVREGRLRGLWILASSCSPDSTAPLSGFRGALRQLGDICREGGEKTTQWLLGHRGPLLALHEPSLAGLPGQASQPSPEELPEGTARLRRFSYVAEALERLTEESGAVLAIDDLQWADPETLVLLHFLRRAGLFERRPLVVVATVRSDKELPSTIQRLWDDPHTMKIELAGLAPSNVRAMVEDMLGVTSAPDDVVRHLVERADGNPLFVTEFLRSLVTRSAVERDDQGRWDVTESTALLARRQSASSIHDLVTGHLQALSDSARTLVRLAAIDGQVDVPVLAHALPKVRASAGSMSGPGEGIEDALRELVRGEILDVSPGGEYVFAHRRLLATAKEDVEAAEQGPLREALASALLATGSPDAARLAEHLEWCGRLPEAREAHRTAAAAALDAYSPRRAEAHLRKYLALSDPAEEAGVRARLELCIKCLLPLGRRAEAMSELSAVLADARELANPALTARVLWRQVAVLRRSGQPDNAMEALANAHELLEQRDDPEVRAHVFNSLAIGHRLAGDNADCRQLLVQAVNIYRMLGDGYGEGIALGNLALLDLDEGRFIESQRRNERAVLAFRTAGRRLYEGIAIHNLGSIAQELGDDESAAALFGRALDLHRETGDRRTKVLTLVRLAATDMRRGAIGNCQRGMARAIELFDALDDPHVESLVHLQSARITRLLEGDWELASAQLDLAAACADRAGAHAARLLVACERGHLALAQGGAGTVELAAATDIGVGSQRAGELVRRLGELREAVGHGPGGCYRGTLTGALSASLRRHLTLSDPQFPHP
jgi:tetratricopeptide (TPR) repeat protein